MRVAVIVTGLLRNFEISMSNWVWPIGIEVDYFLVTWNKTYTSHLHNDAPRCVFSDILRASSILAFKKIVIVNSDAVPDGTGPAKMLHLWHTTFQLAESLEGYDSFVLMRPDVVLVSRVLLDESKQHKVVPTTGVLAQVNTNPRPFSNGIDMVMGFAPDAIPALLKLKNLVNNALNKVRPTDEGFNIHDALANSLELLSDVMDMKVQPGFIPGETWFYFIQRRAGCPGKVTLESLRTEYEYCRWFWANQVKGVGYDDAFGTFSTL